MGESFQFGLVAHDKALECVQCPHDHWIKVSGIDQCQAEI